MNVCYILCERYKNITLFFMGSTAFLTLNMGLEVEQGFVMKGASVTARDRLDSARAQACNHMSVGKYRDINLST